MRILALLAAVVAIAAALSGCTQAPVTVSSSSTTTTALPPPPQPTSLADLTLNPEILLGPGSGEPNIAIAPDGTIYVTPIDHVYRSQDGGKSFADLGTDQTKGHGDGDIAIDATGRIHWLGLFDGNKPIPYQNSDDQGKTFSKSVDLSDGKGSDREWIDATPNGTVYAGWRDAEGYIAAVSTDRGESWSGRIHVDDDFLGGPIVHDPAHEGVVYIPAVSFPALASTSDNGGAQVRLYRSTDGAKNWTMLPVTSARSGPGDPFFVSQIFPVVAVDDAGTLYLVVSLKTDTVPDTMPKASSQYGVYLFVSRDMGETWSEPTILSSDLKAGILPWVAAGAPGRIAVTWYENTVGAPNDALPDVWNVKLLEGLGMDGPASGRVTKVTQLNDQPNHIGSICTNGTLCVAGGDRSLLDFFEVTIGPNGQPAATWCSSVGGTGIGFAAQGTDIYARVVANGTPLR